MTGSARRLAVRPDLMPPNQVVNREFGTLTNDAFALYRQLPSGVPSAYRILANLVSLGKNPEWQ